MRIAPKKVGKRTEQSAPRVQGGGILQAEDFLGNRSLACSDLGTRESLVPTWVVRSSSSA